MAYITPEQIKTMRNEIKNLYPTKQGWKFSLTCVNYSTARLVITQAPIELRTSDELLSNRSYTSVNNYYIDENYKAMPVVKKVLNNINNILNQNNYDNSDSQSDYFDVGHYVCISIGSYDKPFTVIQ